MERLFCRSCKGKAIHKEPTTSGMRNQVRFKQSRTRWTKVAQANRKVAATASDQDGWMP